MNLFEPQKGGAVPDRTRAPDAAAAINRNPDRANDAALPTAERSPALCTAPPVDMINRHAFQNLSILTII
jgi:hypothetical protein